MVPMKKRELLAVNPGKAREMNELNDGDHSGHEETACKLYRKCDVVDRRHGLLWVSQYGLFSQDLRGRSGRIAAKVE